MQKTVYLDRRNYFVVALVVLVALVAASFGRWVIPDGGSSSGASVQAHVASAVPAGLRSNFADLKSEQIDDADALAGITAGFADESETALSSQSERLASLEEPQLHAGATAGLADSSINNPASPPNDLRADAAMYPEGRAAFYSDLNMNELQAQAHVPGLVP